MTKLTTQQKHFAFWTIVFTVLGAILVFFSIVSRFHQLQQETVAKQNSATPRASHGNSKGM